MCPIPAAPKGAPRSEPARPLNPEYHRRLRKRLRENPAALEYLRGLGLLGETIDHFRLGLSLPYASKKHGAVQSDALVYPVVSLDGVFSGKYGYLNVPGVTKGPEGDRWWAHGPARACYAEPLADQSRLFVCEGADDLWLVWQSLRGSRLDGDLFIASTTHGAALPGEWEAGEFWRRWETVYCGYGRGEINEAKASKLAEVCGGNVRRVLPPTAQGPNWPSFWRAADGPEEFARTLDEAPPVLPGIPGGAGAGFGYLPYEPIDVNGAYHGGHLYHTARVVRRGVEITVGDVRDVERLETVVIRSDRTAHTAVIAQAPRGTAQRDRVLRLTDGTLLDRPPRPNRFGTWSWVAIKGYLDGSFGSRPLGEILRDVLGHLKAAALLSSEGDYALLTLTVPVTYAQAIFDRVPVIHVRGERGSGKSRFARAVAAVCANAYVVGREGVESAARSVDESRGLTVVDDLGAKRWRGGEGAEFIRALLSGCRGGVEPGGWSAREPPSLHPLSLYGVKLFVGGELPAGTSRGAALGVRTRRVPSRAGEDSHEHEQARTADVRRLRDELHAWTFGHAALIESTYRKLYPGAVDQRALVMAPLRVMAALAGDEDLIKDLGAAFGRQSRLALVAADPRATIRRALENIARQGYASVSVTHVALEARRLLAEEVGATSLEEPPEWTLPERIGRALRDLELIGPEGAGRVRLRGASLRVHRIGAGIIEGVGANLHQVVPPGVRSPADFCGKCEGCAYRTLGCPMADLIEG